MRIGLSMMRASKQMLNDLPESYKTGYNIVLKRYLETKSMTPLKYKERWVCFACRKMSRILRQVEDAKPGARPESPLKICTKCGALLYNIGSFFAPPPKYKIRQWAAASM